MNDEGRAVLNVINGYARTWSLLLQYDEDNLAIPDRPRQQSVALELKNTRKAIATLKEKLANCDESTDLFGNEQSSGLAGILGAINQTFSGQDLYPSIEEKAANLLYFIINDHPFTDGNKRIGSFLFIGSSPQRMTAYLM